VVTFHFDPGSLSTRFVHDRLRRVFSLPARATYVRVGWPALIGEFRYAAEERGVRITTGSRVTTLPDDRPLILATSLAAASTLLGDDTLTQETDATALVDVAVRQDLRDAFVVSDLDYGGWLERFSLPDPGLAPAGESLVQVQVPLRPDDSRPVAIGRVEALIDDGLPGFRDRTTWRDRAAIDRGDDVYFVGDQVAAPGLLSEVSVSSAPGRSIWSSGLQALCVDRMLCSGRD